MQEGQRKRWLIGGAIVLAVLAAVILWRVLRPAQQSAAFATGNGRIEATEVGIATKLSGRVISVLVKEGDTVVEGQVLAQMDTKVLEANLREAEAAIAQARQRLASAEAGVSQRRNEISAASAVVAQRSSQLKLSTKELGRSKELRAGGYIPDQKVDVDANTKRSDAAQVSAAEAQRKAAEAAHSAASASVLEAQAAIDAAIAQAEMIRSNIEDSTLKAPTNGRVLYRLAEPGEVLSAGGRVLTLLDTSDVYMTVFLPTAQAGLVALGTEARIVLDVRPDLSIPASVTFVSPQAQFTPKAVETSTEREKLMFRVKVTIPPSLLAQYSNQVKTGLPGVAWIRLNADEPWPKTMPHLIPEKKVTPENKAEPEKTLTPVTNSTTEQKTKP